MLLAVVFQRATRLTSAPFRAQTLRSGMRPVIRARPCLEGPVTCPRFLLPFGCRRSLLGRPVPSRIYALLAVGLPAAGQFCRTWTGFPCSALVRYDRCRAPPVPRGRGAHVAGIETSAITAAFQRRALFSGASSIHPEFWVTRLAEVHLIRPSGLPLACNLRMDRRSLGFLPGFTPRRYQRRMPGAGTSVEHSLEANRRSFSTLHFGYLTHYSATSRRTSIVQWPRTWASRSAGLAWAAVRLVM
jgi:hypothetical protein